MEHDSFSNKQFRKEITAKAVLKKKFRPLEVDIDKNIENTDEISREIIRY